MKKIEEMHMDIKVYINVMNQIYKKTFEEHVRRLDLNDTALNNIDVQLGQLTQGMQSRNQVAFQNEKGSSSKGRGQH